MRVRLLPVSFSGPGGGIEPLAWSQHELWLAMERQQSWLPMGGVLVLPAGHTIDNVVDEVQYMMGRYQCLRTRLRLGLPHQVVSERGIIWLEIAQAGPSGPDAVAAQIQRRFEDTPYDYEQEWPIRFAVVTVDDQPVRMVVNSCHLIADAFGFGLMSVEVRDRVTTPVTGMQALEQARWQQTPAGQRQNALAMRYTAQLLRTIPLRCFTSVPQVR